MSRKIQQYTKFFLDTEFNENGRVIDLISIGIVCEHGPEYYAISKDFVRTRCNDWVKINVLPNLVIPGFDCKRRTRGMISREIVDFITTNTKRNTKPEFYGYYADYDWVVLCQMFGAMINLPKNFPMFCMDLKQSSRMLGIENLPDQDADSEHNALYDARWNNEVYKYIYAQNVLRT